MSLQNFNFLTRNFIVRNKILLRMTELTKLFKTIFSSQHVKQIFWVSGEVIYCKHSFDMFLYFIFQTLLLFSDNVTLNRSANQSYLQCLIIGKKTVFANIVGNLRRYLQLSHLYCTLSQRVCNDKEIWITNQKYFFFFFFKD